jgi:hypothetical protein
MKLKQQIARGSARISNAFLSSYLCACGVLENPWTVMFFLLGVFTLVFGITENSLAQAASAPTPPDTRAIDEAICWILYFQNHSWGALLAATTGVSALVSAAVGNYKAALSFLAVCIGSYAPAPLATLYFGDAALATALGAIDSGCVISSGPRLPSG